MKRSRIRRLRKNQLKTRSIIVSEDVLGSREFSTLSYDLGSVSSDVDEMKSRQVMVHNMELEKSKEKDYSTRDPSFLDEFESSEEIVVEVQDEGEVKVEKVEEEEEEVSSDPDKYAVYEQVSPVTSKDIYEHICVEKTDESNDSLYKPHFDVTRRRKENIREISSEKCLSDYKARQKDFVSGETCSLLVSGLIELALYKPDDPVAYFAQYLRYKLDGPSKDDLEPDPRKIQELVDTQAKEAKKRVKSPVVQSEGGLEKILERLAALDTTDDSDICPTVQFKEMYQMKKDELLKKTIAVKEGIKGKIKFDPSCLGPTTLVKGKLPRQQTFRK